MLEYYNGQHVPAFLSAQYSLNLLMLKPGTAQRIIFTTLHHLESSSRCTQELIRVKTSLWLWENHQKDAFFTENTARGWSNHSTPPEMFLETGEPLLQGNDKRLLLLFPSLLRGAGKVPPRFLNIALVIRLCMMGLWAAQDDFRLQQHNTGRVPALLRALPKVTTRGDTAQEPESLSLKHNQKRSSQSCSKLDYDVGKWEKGLPVYKLCTITLHF